MNKPKEKPLTKAQEIFGKNFGNTQILNERPADLRSDNPHQDKELFKKYKATLRWQTHTIKKILR